MLVPSVHPFGLFFTFKQGESGATTWPSVQTLPPTLVGMTRMLGLPLSPPPTFR